MVFEEAIKILRPKNFEEVEIERAYIANVKIFHPDVPTTGNEKQFKLVCEAYKLLKANPNVKSSWGNKTPFASDQITEHFNSTEAVFHKQVCESLKARGVLYLTVHGHGCQAAGWPDLQVYSKWWTGHLEFKVDNNTLSNIQKLKLRQLSIACTDAYCLRLRLGKLYLENSEGEQLTCLGNWKKPYIFLPKVLQDYQTRLDVLKHPGKQEIQE